MELEELKRQVSDAAWFEHLGESVGDETLVSITSLEAWAGSGEQEKIEGEDIELAEKMDWLPSSRDQRDPVHGHSLEVVARDLDRGQEFRKQILEVYKLALTSLRKMKPHPLLKVGPHDFTEAAKGAALYGARQAAAEVVVGRPGFWCALMKLYHAGHWPCGILPNGKVVVL